MQRIITLAAILLLCLAFTAQAQNQQELNIAAGKDYEAADKELNRVYSQLKGRLEKDERRKLAKAEQAWIKFRDAECDFRSFENTGGTIYPLVYGGAAAALTRQRTADLQEILDEYSSR
jgi:uncharacterized protein YecT (DUF1311 family)